MNAAFTSGARSVDSAQDNAQAMREAWQNRTNVATYTRSKNGAMSVDGKKAGGSTWTYTPKNDDGGAVINPKTGQARQSGRSTTATRRQRDYDTRQGMNNISPRVVERWRQLGWVRESNGNLVGDGTNVRGITIHQKPDGNYSMGLATG